MAIKKFIGNYYFLSNFFPSQITFENIIYPTAEHAFQAAKTLDIDLRIKISQAKNAGKAKYYGRSLKLRDDWEDVKVNIMKDILEIKFADKKLKDRLIATNDQELIEGNDWKDTFWGVCNGIGKNTLGMLLMELRNKLKE